MLVASTVGVFLIPMLYVVFQRLRERFHGCPAHRKSAPEATADLDA
jgi:HAE1 family hydrophobic/amphiphilic exporter-1